MTWARSKEELTKLQQVDKDSYEARYLAAQIAAVEKQPDKAIEELQEALKKQPGKAWFDFKLFGLRWQARIVPSRHNALDHGNTIAYCDFENRVMAFSDATTKEQLRTAFAHELQHAIEEHADVDYEQALSPDTADRCTDQVARGWLYVIRECPEILSFLRDEPPA